ncbi:MAG: nitroreductase family deazaflavin-dependent oxidoreductase [Myxococcales bacterium]|nr:nitroreductase family deazaflavin-dependent oxidoreductase [Myxococcales bacterium]
MALYFKPRGELLGRISRIHTWLYRKTRGRVGHGLIGLKILLLGSVGRKSGQLRVAPLPYFRVADYLVVIASNAAQAKHPAWYHNIRANPLVDVQLKGERFSARTRVLEGEERERAWRVVTTKEPRYAHYQELVERKIPVVALERVAT